VAKIDAARGASQGGGRGGLRGRKKINEIIAAQKESYPQEKGKIRLFFEDEASFGRISEPKYCWCGKNERPIIPKQKVRQYRTVFGAAEPETGDFVYMIEQNEKRQKGKRGKNKKGAMSRKMNSFMKQLARTYPKDKIVLVCDKASWHTSRYLKIPKRILLVHISPYTPEMNPIEQLWRELRTAGFHNKYFRSIEEVETTLYNTIANLEPATLRSITQRNWFMNKSNLDCV
jgi:putative transposase